MALLDYLFPMQTSDTITGLLGEDEARKIRQQSQTAGLLNLGANLLALSGPSSQQRSFGQMLAPSLLAGYQAAQGATESQLQQRLAAQKMERENAFRKAISESMVTRPTGTGLTQTGPESQAALLARPEFGGDFVEETKAALMSNPNLPTTRTLDQDKFMAALAEYSPLEFAKMQMQANKPGDDPLAKFKAFMQLTPEQRKQYSEFASITTPKTVLDMTGGQKGFENENKLRDQFKSEPVYKAFSEMKSAYGQITDAIKQASPAGDLAAATKFMKLLDPGSVVRESELAMAMAASGALDRATNYAQNVIRGTKLTPTQRADFQALADRLFGTAAQTYNAKRGELVQFGQEYGLNAERALGAPAKLPEPKTPAQTGLPSMSAIEAELERRRKARQ